MMSVLGAYWIRPIFGKIKEVLKELKQFQKTGKHIGNKGKVASKKEEKQHMRGKHARHACRKT